MDWANERYVRLYVRDTVTWKLLPWQSQLLIPALMRKLDRAGRLDLDGEEVADAVRAVLEKVPEQFISVGIQGALERGVLRIEGGTLVMPNFAAAQTAQPSAALRKREERDRKEAAGLKRIQKNGVDVWVEETGREVTIRDLRSQPVTTEDQGHSSLAEPSLAEPSKRKEEKNMSSLPQTAAAPLDLVLSPLAIEETGKRAKEVLAAFAYWKERTGHHRAKFTTARKRLLDARMKEGHTLEELKHAVDGCLLSKFHQGENQNGAIYDNLELIFRDAKHVEDFCEDAETYQQRKERRESVTRAVAEVAQRHLGAGGPNSLQQVERRELPEVSRRGEEVAELGSQWAKHSHPNGG